MAHETKTVSVNGVDVGQLRETLEAMRENPNLGSAWFHVVNRWQDSTHNQSEIGEFHGAGEDRRHPETFTAQCDEPEVLLGDDEAPNPVEWLLHALAGCVTTSMVCHAAARGIHIESVESEIHGEIDLRGFLGLSEEVPRGYQRIEVTMHVKSDAAPEKLAELAQFSPVYNTLTHGVPVDLKVQAA